MVVVAWAPCAAERPGPVCLLVDVSGKRRTLHSCDYDHQKHKNSSHTYYSVTYLLYQQITVHPVIVRDLEPGPGCLSPLISKKRSRPKTTSIRKQEKPLKRKVKRPNSWCRHKVTINVAVDQLTIVRLPCRESTAILT